MCRHRRIGAARQPDVVVGYTERHTVAVIGAGVFRLTAA